jgi:shikimate kinase
MNIYLIGLPGSGKSTLGKRLAQALNYHFIDLDHYIEKASNRTIEQIFQEEGEHGFRLKEKAALHELSNLSRHVIATGGGAPCFFDNMDWMNTHGLTLFINPGIEPLATRLNKMDNTHRPMLLGKSYPEIKAFLEVKSKERLPFYELATIEFTNPLLNYVEVIEKIKSLNYSL